MDIMCFLRLGDRKSEITCSHMYIGKSAFTNANPPVFTTYDFCCLKLWAGRSPDFNSFVSTYVCFCL